MSTTTLTHGSLFTGIGGFDLAAQWMGWHNVFQVEKDKWCQKLLAKNFPHTSKFEDIKDFTAHEYTNKIDVISGGFPCQPFSVAGKQRGESDDRYLWHEMLRVIGTVKPTYVVGENVTGIIGMALDTVLFDLEAQGYTTETFIIPACGKNAWHKRDRVWVIAYTNGNGCNSGEHNRQKRYLQAHKGIAPKNNTERSGWKFGAGAISSIYTDTTASGFSERGSEKMVRQEQKQELKRLCGISTDTNDTDSKKQWQPIAASQKFFAPRCSRWWQTEPGVGRVVNGVPHRVDRLKGLGNAIVPQIAYEIFKVIAAIHHQ